MKIIESFQPNTFPLTETPFYRKLAAIMKYLWLLFISVSAFASSKDDALSLLNQFQTITSTSDRIQLFSHSFINLPYGSTGPLGEGENGKYDQDPLYRFDTFDCTTFIETTISLALSKNLNEFENTMNFIRYENAEVNYLRRNHFPSLQWIPNNIQNGTLTEINDLIIPAHEQFVAEAEINFPNWLKKTTLQAIQIPNASNQERESILKELQSHSSEFSTKIARINYIPISTILARPELLNKIPNGSIINFIRPNWDLTEAIGTHMNVSHQGFVFQTSTGTILRHASASGAKKVVDVSLLDYLKNFASSPTLKGIHLLKTTAH